MKTRTRLLILIITSIMMMFGVAAIVSAQTTAITPTYASAVVDGDGSEWDLTNDTSLALIRAGGQGGQTDVLAKAYFRYDCVSKTLFILVQPEEGWTFENTPEEQWIKINGSKVVDDTNGNDGVPPDFACGLLVCEASIPVEPGNYTLEVHTLLHNGEPDQTAGNEAQISIDCTTTNVGITNVDAHYLATTLSPDVTLLLLIVAVLATVCWIILKAKSKP